MIDINCYIVNIICIGGINKNVDEIIKENYQKFLNFQILIKVLIFMTFIFVHDVVPDDSGTEYNK